MNNLQNNAYFGHGENILLTMLADDNESVQRRAVDKALQIEQYEDNKGRADEIMSFSAHMTKVRKFKIPKIDFNAESYDTLINVDQECKTESLLKLPYNKIEGIRKSPEKFSHPCHNQAVEKHVTLVTEASSNVVGFKSRDGLIRQKIRSRKLMKSFDSKNQFLGLN